MSVDPILGAIAVGALVFYVRPLRRLVDRLFASVTADTGPRKPPQGPWVWWDSVTGEGQMGGLIGRMPLRALPLAMLLASCGGGSGECAGDHTGLWIGTSQTDQITLGADCSYEYRGPRSCQSRGSYAAPLEGTRGSLLVTIESMVTTAGAPCLPAGHYSCDYVMSSSTLTVDCGAGALSYAR